ncbi:MAG: adenylate kinase [Actinomycetota bacterium]
MGNSGSGKSTLARRISDAIGVERHELDAIQHQPDWTPIDPPEFLRRVEAIAAGEGWVVDGNYREVVVEGPVWERADTIVWLDLPRRTVMRQVIWRTVSRGMRCQELWNGNRESLRNLLSWDPERSVVRWAWTQHGKYRRRYGAAMASPPHEGVRFVHLTSHAEADRWLASIGDGAS